MASSSENTKIAALIGAVVAFLIATGYLYLRVDSLVQDVAELRQSVVTELSKVRVTTPVAPAAAAEKKLAVELARVADLRRQLEERAREADVTAAQAAARVKAEATRYTDKAVGRLGEETASQHMEVAETVGHIRDSANNRIDNVTEKVEKIRDEVASTRFELQKTVADLKRTRGDLGIQSGLIATNARELEALKLLDERNYYDFHIQKSRQPQRVGDISIVLRKTDPKDNRYTIEIIARDQRTEKKDRAVNEPVQFYVGRAKQPYELVVNEVQKDYVAGYLATPKQLVELREAASN